VIFTLPWAAEERLLRLQTILADYPVDLRLAPDLAAYHGGSEDGLEAGKLRLLRLADRPMRGWAGAAKTVEDYVLALGALAVAAVPMALIALAIRLDSPGPVLFRQRRTGFNGRDFFVFKFRTMYHEHADYEVQRQVQEGDPRVTRVGAILRRTSLDELPQIFNVLRGEMSFIGPRPHAPGTRAGGKLFEEVTDRYAARHRVKPGLTGLAQVRGYRGQTDTEEKLLLRVESDLEYIEKWSLWLDFVILLRTLLAVARMQNAH
jgi:exopolysaccharide biosynthesis polyprenyl glycosylphosphotransferase